MGDGIHTFRGVVTDRDTGAVVVYTGRALKFAEFERQCRDAYVGLLAAPPLEEQMRRLHVEVEELA